MRSLHNYNNFLVRRKEDGNLFLYVESDSKENSGTRFGYLKYPDSPLTKTESGFFTSLEPELFSFGHSNPTLQKEIKFLLPSREKYLVAVNALLKHIRRGDIYEVNYCVQFVAEEAVIDPAYTFRQLDSISHAPHACFAKFGDVYILCSSPERFLKRDGNRIITQPIKGTAPRGKNNEEDQRLRSALSASIKDRTENVMAVDVARHDLSRIAAKGTVKVDELCAVYSFEQVHQMISTVSCEVKHNISSDEIIEATFPMASMTGAPKLRAMQLIDQYENFDRGFYSGSIGVIEANGNFDFNVVIRSIIYNKKIKRISFGVGSAITAMSDPEEEWEECMLKAKAMMQVLNGI